MGVAIECDSKVNQLIMGGKMKKRYVAVYQNKKYQVRLLNEVLEDVKKGILEQDSMLLTFELSGEIEEKKKTVESILNGSRDNYGTV